jgi:hypothetical protein
MRETQEVWGSWFRQERGQRWKKKLTAELVVSRLVGARPRQHHRARHDGVRVRAGRRGAQPPPQLVADRGRRGAQRVDAQRGAEGGARERLRNRREARGAESPAEVAADLRVLCVFVSCVWRVCGGGGEVRSFSKGGGGHGVGGVDGPPRQRSGSCCHFRRV